MTSDQFVEHVANYILYRTAGTRFEELNRDVMIQTLRRLKLRLWENGAQGEVSLEDPALLLRWHAWVLAWERGVMTRIREILLVKSFFRYLSSVGAIRYNVTTDLRSPTYVKGPQKFPLTLEQYETLRDACKKPYLRWFLQLGWHAGFAMVDCCILKWGSVDLERLIISHKRSKTGSLCTVPILEGGELHLEFKKRWDKLQKFRTSRGYSPDPMIERYVEPYSPALDNKHPFHDFRELVNSTKYAGRDITFHCLRASFCTRLANAQVSSVVAMKMTGHACAQQFSRYVRPDEGALRKALEIALEIATDLPENTKEPVAVPEVDVIQFKDHANGPGGFPKPDVNVAEEQ